MRPLLNLLALVVLVASLPIGAGPAAAVDYLIEVQSGGPGTVTPTPNVLVPAGGNQTFTFTPDGCNGVVDVTVDDVSVGSGLTEYTFTNVQSDHALYVSFGPSPAATTTTLDVRPVAGQCAVPETLTATVTIADGGQVQFFNDGTLLGTRTLTSSVASYVVAPGLATGTYTFSATYLGTSCFDSSSSPVVSYEVADTGPTPMTLPVTLSRDTLDQNTSVNVFSTLWIGGSIAGNQNGQVTFFDGGTARSTSALTNGHCNRSLLMDSPGVRVITAVASLVQCPGTITSEPETLFVRTATSMTLTITPTQADSGESVLMTAVVSPSYAAGSIRFLDVTSAAEVGTASLVDGTASLTYGPLSGPTRMMQASYDGNAVVMGCTSNQVLLQVGRQRPPVVDTTLWIANGPVHSIVYDTGTIYIGGNFTQVGPANGPSIERNHIAAIDATTGAATAWNPNADGDVTALAVDGGTVYAGGKFTSIGGLAGNHIAALDAATGAATAWNPNADGSTVNALAVSGGVVYAGGDFRNIGGQHRNFVAALATATGSVTAWNPSANSTVYALALSGSTVYAGGAFFFIGGATRHCLAALNATTGAATAWNPNVSGSVFSIVPSGGTVYIAGPFGSVAFQNRPRIAAVDAVTGAPTDWNPPAPDNNLDVVAVSDGIVYVGGSFTYIGDQSHSGIATLDAESGLATYWNPTVFGNVPPENGHPAYIHALALNGSTVYIGGEFTYVGGRPQENFAAIGGTGIPVAVSLREPPPQNELRLLSANPTSSGARLQYSVAHAGHVRLEVLDVTGRIERTLADRVHTPGRYIVNWDGVGRRGRLSPGLYFVRLVAPDLVTTRKLAIIQ